MSTKILVCWRLCPQLDLNPRKVTEPWTDNNSCLHSGGRGDKSGNLGSHDVLWVDYSTNECPTWWHGWRVTGSEAWLEGCCSRWSLEWCVLSLGLFLFLSPSPFPPTRARTHTHTTRTQIHTHVQWSARGFIGRTGPIRLWLLLFQISSFSSSHTTGLDNIQVRLRLQVIPSSLTRATLRGKISLHTFPGFERKFFPSSAIHCPSVPSGRPLTSRSQSLSAKG